ncbi:MAG: hypothetical protein ETSY2_43555 [Candidatus Entotheonella gemina]|uniref:HNH domain-containing protein n=2 Tax=Candidatus Entotheonella TaxID=93171 RepID=W4LKV3_9BACT|nr:MAG: hypothetical protein ETSY2_43555 [Candidatus Entotheonella gemina]
MFDLDHFTPQCIEPEKREDYDNLVYACHSCNLTKGDQKCPDPSSVLTSDQVIVHADGALEALTQEAERLIRILDLDDEECRAWRRIMIRIIELAEERDQELDKQLMGFPDDLPDLSRLRPPGGNTRPDGIRESYFEVRRYGELPATY